MRSWILLLIVGIYFTSITEFFQFLKIPILIEHFFEHQQENKTLSFSQFFSQHYTQENDHDGDADKDSKLPFKSHSCSLNAFSFVTLQAIVCFNFSNCNSISKSKPIFNYYSCSNTSSYLISIWQPPQIC